MLGVFTYGNHDPRWSGARPGCMPQRPLARACLECGVTWGAREEVDSERQPEPVAGY